MRKPVLVGFTTRFHTNRAVQPQKMARGLKFRIQEVKGLYYLCSKNKGADQLCGYHEADLRLCFRICKKPVFSRCGSNMLTFFTCSITSLSSSSLPKLQTVVRKVHPLYLPVASQPFCKHCWSRVRASSPTRRRQLNKSVS